MKTFRVLLSVGYGEWVEVRAENEEQAIDKVDKGDWKDEDIVSSQVVWSETTGDVEECSVSRSKDFEWSKE